MSVRTEPRTPQLRFAPEGKCSPELPADLEPALGRGSSRSHPSLARNPSLTERSGETDPKHGAVAGGELGGCTQTWPSFPPTTLPEHLAVLFRLLRERCPFPGATPRLGLRVPTTPGPGALPLNPPPWGALTPPGCW